jgi:phosphoglycolate phosphatase
MEVATPLPHAHAFLNFCQTSGIRCFVLSSALERHVRQQADAFELTPFFDHIYAGIRDKRHLIHTLLETHQLTPSTTAFIGDMTHDIDTAHHGGLLSIAVLTGYQDAARLSSAQPMVISPDLAHLQRTMRK